MPRMPRAVIVGLLLSAQAVHARPRYERFVFPDGLFRLELPRGWEPRPQPEARRLLLIPPEPARAGSFQAQITVAFYRERERYLSLQEFLAVNGGSKARAGRVGKAKGFLYERETKAEDFHLGPLLLHRAYALLAARGGFYVLALSVSERPGQRVYAGLKPDFQHVLESFEPGAPAAAATP